MRRGNLIDSPRSLDAGSNCVNRIRLPALCREDKSIAFRDEFGGESCQRVAAHPQLPKAIFQSLTNSREEPVEFSLIGDVWGIAGFK